MILVPTKGDRDKKRNKQPLENDARTTSRSIVALSSAQNTAHARFFSNSFRFWKILRKWKTGLRSILTASGSNKLSFGLYVQVKFTSSQCFMLVLVVSDCY